MVTQADFSNASRLTNWSTLAFVWSTGSFYFYQWLEPTQFNGILAGAEIVLS